MTLTIELPDKLDAALKAQARANGVSEAGFARKVLEKFLEPTGDACDKGKSDVRRVPAAATAFRENSRDMA